MNSNVEQNQKLSLIQRIEQSGPAQLANLPEVADRFKTIFKVMNGGNDGQAEVKYEAEKFHFMKLIQDKPELQACSKLSLYGCFLDMAVNGLSFDPSMKHAYVVSFNTNVGTKNEPKWEKRASLMISGYGELQMRVRQGQIRYADNPILVYEGDQFQHGTRDGKVFLDHVASFPRKKDAAIIACYIRLERNDGSVDYKVLGIDEVMKFRAFSKDQNSKAWTDGLPGMVQAKTMKHAFRSYPKIRMGDFSQLQSQVVETEPVVEKIDYCLNGHTPAPVSQMPEAAENFTPTMIIEPAVKDDDFAQPASPNKEEGVKHESDQF